MATVQAYVDTGETAEQAVHCAGGNLMLWLNNPEQQNATLLNLAISQLEEAVRRATGSFY